MALCSDIETRWGMLGMSDRGGGGGGQTSRHGRKVKVTSTVPLHASRVRLESPVSLPQAFISDIILFFLMPTYLAL